VLAAGAFFGVANLVPSLVGAACIALTFLVGRRLFDTWTGLLAAGLLLASPFFLMQSSNFMSHNTAALFMLISLFFILRRDRPVLFGTIAGLCFGLAVNTRSLTMVALAVPFGALILSYLVTRKEDARPWLKHTAPFVAGNVVMLAAMLLYNQAITGDAFTSGYAQTQGSGGELFGFSHGHTLDIGLRNLQAQLMALLLVFNAWPAWLALALVMLPFILGTREPRDYFLAACVLLTVVLYVGYRFSGIYEGPRYWYETIPFLVLLSARGALLAVERLTYGAEWLRDKLDFGPQPRCWAGAAVVFAATAALVLYGSGGWLFGWAEEENSPLVPYEASAIEGLFGVDDRLVRLADDIELENALVLVKPCGFFKSPACYGSVFLRNQPDFDGKVVWAHYDETFNAETIAAFPGRTVYVATWDPVASIEPLLDGEVRAED
jgi:4-amino-4-deoxy-L-arabinose transferase-like glycosyltransferase